MHGRPTGAPRSVARLDIDTGPAFAGMCNVIGQALGLPPVRSMKKRGKDKDLPSCAHWPLNVRPRDYYLGAYKPHDQAETDAADAGDPDRDEADPSGAGDPLAALLDQVLADLDAGRVVRPRDHCRDPRPHLG